MSSKVLGQQCLVSLMRNVVRHQSITPVARELIICVMLKMFHVISLGFRLVLNALMKI